MSDVRRIVIPAPDNWHCHLREGPLMNFMIDHLIESGFRGRVLAEPNLKDPLLFGHQSVAYKRKIDSALQLRRSTLIDPKKHKQFEVVMTIQITEKTTSQMIYEAYELGVKVGKVYPRDVTTNSENGVVDYEKIYPALTAAQECGMIVQFHGEHPSHDVEGRDKEAFFIRRIMDQIVAECKSLKISLEHISTAFAAHWVKTQDKDENGKVRIVGGLAPQYLYCTQDDVLGYTARSEYKGHTELICKPMLKWNPDRAALQKAAISGEPCFVFAPDDAPHFDSDKGPGKANCGVFHTTESLAMTAEVFEKRNALDKFPVFFGAGVFFYGYPPNEEFITLEREDWQVPLKYPVEGTEERVTPALPGRTLKWKVKLVD